LAASSSRFAPLVASFATRITSFVASFTALSTPFHAGRLGRNI
jgi:hypothetical protein